MCCVAFRYNSKCTSASLKSVQVLVPVNGVVTNVQCTPEAQWLVLIVLINCEVVHCQVQWRNFNFE